jgi:NAD dependent epimerase/dehydratase family enzyme
MRVAVTGASGLIGSALVPHLRAEGHEVSRLVRGSTAARDEVRWDPATGFVDLAALEGTDAVVHLAGAGVGDHRWTTAYKAEIRSSRVRGTDTIARAMAQLDRRPDVLVSGSAIGFYGDTGDRVVDETAPRGSTFLAHPRTGLVLGGPTRIWRGRSPSLSLGLLWPIFSLGVGGRLGSGRQWWSYISLRDQVRALTYLLEHLEGPVNLTAPNPATNAEVTKELGALLNRPTALPVPAAVLKAVLGEFSSEILGSIRVHPTRLLEAGFTFEDPTIAEALAWVKSTR